MHNEYWDGKAVARTNVTSDLKFDTSRPDILSLLSFWVLALGDLGFDHDKLPELKNYIISSSWKYEQVMDWMIVTMNFLSIEDN